MGARIRELGRGEMLKQVSDRSVGSWVGHRMGYLHVLNPPVCVADEHLPLTKVVPQGQKDSHYLLLGMSAGDGIQHVSRVEMSHQDHGRRPAASRYTQISCGVAG
jgi:hypothetical protein